jgi:ribosomal protein L11 methyltransferase
VAEGGGDRTVRVTVPVADADLATDRLWQAGASAIAERAVPGGVVLDAGGDPGSLLAAVAGRWPAETVVVDLAAALDAWRPYARAVTVGDRLVVRPPWVAPLVAPRAVEVIVDPGRAFGSGAHPSTRLALAALVQLVQGGERVLDVGCGSGVLALAALALGGAEAVGVDIDPAAREATTANAARNGMGDRLAVTDSIARAAGPTGGRYPLVVANLLLPDLVSLAPEIATAVHEHGALVVSGVLEGQRAELEQAFAGASVVAAAGEDGWLALTLRVP